MSQREQEWIDAYQMRGALWMHDGNSKRPHACLTSGQHSNGFFNSELIVKDELLLHEAALELVELFLEQGGDLSLVDRVVGPQKGATKLAESISGVVGYRRGYPCEWASPVKVGEGDEKSFIFDDPQRKVLPGERVLLCDDVVTSYKSVALVAQAAREEGGITLPETLVLVNRSGKKVTNMSIILSLIERHLPNWNPEECLLCQEGSIPLRPKEGNNWELLTKSYE